MTLTKFSVAGLLAVAQAAKFGGFGGMGDLKNFGPSLGNIGQDVDRKLGGFGGGSSRGHFDASSFGFNGGFGAPQKPVQNHAAPWQDNNSYGGYSSGY